MCILITTLSPGLVSSENGSVAEERIAHGISEENGETDGWRRRLLQRGKDLMEDIETGPPPMSINWDLENADSIVDARRSSAGIVRVRDPKKKTGNNR